MINLEDFGKSLVKKNSGNNFFYLVNPKIYHNSFEEVHEYYYNSALENKDNFKKIVIIDPWEYRENTFIKIVERLYEEKIFEEIDLYLISYPSEDYKKRLKDKCRLYHLNNLILNVILENIDYIPQSDKLQNFICLNNRPNCERAAIVDLFLQLGYIDNVSWSANNYSTEHNFTEQAKWELKEFKLNEISNLDWIYDTYKIKNDDNKDLWGIKSSIFKTSINVVTEGFLQVHKRNSDWNIPDAEPSVLVSEKSIKPIMAKQVFLIQGCIGTLTYLKNMGFQTFSSYIDESYDSNPDWFERTKLIVSETDRLMKLSPQEWNQFIENVQPILEHNRNHAIYLANSGKIVVDLN